MTVADKDRKNCHNCRHLEWVEAEEWDSNGFTCNKRYEDLWAKDKGDWLHSKLEDERYLMKSKVCFEGKSHED